MIGTSVRPRRYAWLLLLALPLLAVATMMWLDGGLRGPMTPEQAPTPTVTAVPAPPPAAPRPDRAELERLHQAFIGTYYRIGPDDSTDSRRAAVEGLGLQISEEARSSMDFTVYVSSDADRFRITNRLQMQGTVADGATQIAAEHDAGTRLYVTTIVTVTTVWPDGRVQSAQNIRTGTVWQWTEGTGWQMTAFGESEVFQ
jgi:hypothetical protein